jgi:hypothetical protein
LIPFLPAAMDSSGVVTFLANGTTGVSWIGAQAYATDKPIASTSAVDAADVRSGGVAYTSGGAVRLTDATAGLPAGAVTIGGFAVSAGALCYTTDAPDSSSTRLGGVAVASDGRVHASVTV